MGKGNSNEIRACELCGTDFVVSAWIKVDGKKLCHGCYGHVENKANVDGISVTNWDIPWKDIRPPSQEPNMSARRGG